MFILILSLIALASIISFIYTNIHKNKKTLEKYSRGFPPIVRRNFDFFYRVVTPLKALSSPLKQFKDLKELPEIFIYNPKYFSPVRDQGRCGGCWAFVICEILSDNITLKLIKFGKNLNVQQLLSCYPGDGCDGAAPEDVLLWLGKTQFNLSISNEYLQVSSDCIKSDDGINVANGSILSLCKNIKRECIVNPTDEESKLLKENILRMKKQLYKDGPFFGSISIYQDFFNFKGDKAYIKNSDQLIGGHAIEIVGWCDPGVDIRDGFQDGYWVCKNSWSTDWAPSYEFAGYFAIKMGVNECGIESRSGSADTDVEYVWEKNGNIPEQLVINTYPKLINYMIDMRKKDLQY